jgi:hypothetical protein
LLQTPQNDGFLLNSPIILHDMIYSINVNKIKITKMLIHLRFFQELDLH